MEFDDFEFSPELESVLQQAEQSYSQRIGNAQNTAVNTTTAHQNGANRANLAQNNWNNHSTVANQEVPQNLKTSPSKPLSNFAYKGTTNGLIQTTPIAFGGTNNQPVCNASLNFQKTPNSPSPKPPAQSTTQWRQQQNVAPQANANSFSPVTKPLPMQNPNWKQNGNGPTSPAKQQSLPNTFNQPNSPVAKQLSMTQALNPTNNYQNRQANQTQLQPGAQGRF